MTSDHNSLQGAGPQHSPAPSLPVYAFCSLCNQVEEAQLIQPYSTDVFAAHLCPKCIEWAEREYREIHQRQEAVKSQNLSRALIVAMVVWAVVIVWGWGWWR